MSATVRTPTGRHIHVPKANHYSIDSETGYVHLETSRYCERIAVFKEWEHVVIEPDRGRNGRFVKKG